jgi:dephospho-CoA kinase
LRKAIFSDPVQCKKVDTILHPLVRQELFRLAEVARTRGVDLVAEVPLLFEKGWQADFDVTLVVSADQKSCVERIMARDHVSRPDAEEALGAQMSLDEKCKLGDLVIDNSGSFAVTLKMLSTLAEKIAAGTLFRGKRKKG